MWIWLKFAIIFRNLKQKTVLQYKIPQNVQVEDRITSFLTIRQLIICAIGGGIAYVFYITLSPNYYAEVWLPPVLFFSVLTIAVAFIKINDIPFTKWALLLTEFMMVPRRRVWDKTVTANLLFSFIGSRAGAPQEQSATQKNAVAQTKDLSALEAIASQIDRNPFEHIQAKNDHIETVDDHAVAHAALLPAEELERHEKRLEDVILANIKRPSVEVKPAAASVAVAAKPAPVAVAVAAKPAVAVATIPAKIVAPSSSPSVAVFSASATGAVAAETTSSTVDLEAQKQKKLLGKRAFPMPKIDFLEQTPSSSLKRLTPVREKAVDTRAKPVVPAEHKELLSQINNQ